MKRIEEKVLFKGQWLTVKEGTFVNAQGQQVKWESIGRVKKDTTVIVVPLLMPSRRFILIKQYRFAINDYILAFPAGMSSGNEDQALRELEEETGFCGVIVEKSPFLQVNAGLMDERTQIVVVHVDENDPANKNPVQNLEPTEEIEVIIVPQKQAKQFLLKEVERGTRIAVGLWNVLGVDLGVS